MDRAGEAPAAVAAVDELIAFPSEAATDRAAGHPRSKRGAQRQTAIVAAASELFRERGFRATSLDDIGARAGVSGPAIYRYFKSKHELLTVLLEQAAITWRRTVDEVLNREEPPLVTLEHLIDAAVALELENGNLRSVYFQEVRMLDEDARRRLARLDRVTMAEWVHLLCEVRPGLTDEEARTAVVLVDGMLRSVSHLHTSVDRAHLTGVIRDMALGALLALGTSSDVAAVSW